MIGCENIIQHLQNAIQGNKVSHAYMFHGETGMGKRTIGKAFAKTLLCDEGGLSPCNHCVSCMQFDTDNHPDLIWLTHEKASIGVDDIRLQVNNDIAIRPYKGPYKIYIIPDGDKMTEAAQNALLKTIEEPPSYGIIILLVSNLNSIIQTILSRCVQLNMKSVDKLKIKNHLMKQYQIPDYLAEVAANFAGGNVGKAIKYATSEEFIRMKEDVLHILKYIDEMSLYEVIVGLKTISEGKTLIEDYIDLMMLWYRDILMFKASNDPDLILYKEERSFIMNQAKIISYEGIHNIIKGMEKAKARIKANVNFDVAIQLMLLTIKENSND